MRILFVLFSVAALSFSAHAQQDVSAASDTSYWKKGGFNQLNFNQVALHNWSGGGENSYAATAVANLFANYEKGRITVDNSFDGKWGLLRSGGETRKNEDQLILQHKTGYQLIKDKKRLYLSGLLDFKSQFTRGYKYGDAGSRDWISNFLAPAYLNVGSGIDFRPAEYFSVYVSPVTGKFTFVTANDSIDETTYGLDLGATARPELGASAAIKFKKDIVKNVNLESKMGLFTNYTDPDSQGEIDMDWKTTVNLQVNKYLSASVMAHLIYDEDIKVKDTTGDGELDASGLQVMESISIGLIYKFGDK